MLTSYDSLNMNNVNYSFRGKFCLCVMSSRKHPPFQFAISLLRYIIKKEVNTMLELNLFFSLVMTVMLIFCVKFILVEIKKHKHS